MVPSTQSAAIDTELPPYRQGDLDGLCGPYALINALRVTLEPYHALTDEACRDLLRQTMRATMSVREIAEALHGGVPWPLMCKLAKALAASTPLPRRMLAVRELRAGTPGDRWATLEALLRSRIAMLFHDEVNDHYTVAIGITPSRIRIFEGDEPEWLSRSGQRLDHGLAFVLEF